MEEEIFIYFDIELTVKYENSYIMLSLYEQFVMFGFISIWDFSDVYTKFYLN